MRWLIFDAVHTLIAPREPVAVTYHAAGAKHGSSLVIEDVRTRFSAVFRQSEELSFIADGEPTPGLTTSEDAERRRWGWVVAQVFDAVRLQKSSETSEVCLDGVVHSLRLPKSKKTSEVDVAMEPLFNELWQHYADPAAWIVLPDVAETLHVLRQRGFQLGIASNFDSRLDAVLARLPELLRLDAVFVSSRVGYRKPAPEFYQHVITACGVRADEITMIGDNVDHDYTAPRAAGMTARLLDLQGVRALLSAGEPGA